jgi:hypothetical protein
VAREDTEMKKILLPLCGAIMSFVVFNVFPVLRYFYRDWVVQSPADENLLTAIIIFVEWPVYLAIGATGGFLLARRQQAK